MAILIRPPAAQRRLFDGMAMAVVQSGGKSGRLTVKAAADGLARRIDRNTRCLRRSGLS